MHTYIYIDNSYISIIILYIKYFIYKIIIDIYETNREKEREREREEEEKGKRKRKNNDDDG